MSDHRIAAVVSAGLVAISLSACSDQLGTNPSAGDRPALVTTLAQPVPGSYEISFQPTVTGLGVILVGSVRDGLNAPAESGTAFFQVCSLHGVPAPRAECDAAGGTWAQVGKAGILPTGQALLTYDLAPAPGTVIGFRFRYIGQGSGIANGLSDPADHTF